MQKKKKLLFCILVRIDSLNTVFPIYLMGKWPPYPPNSTGPVRFVALGEAIAREPRRGMSKHYPYNSHGDFIYLLSLLGVELWT